MSAPADYGVHSLVAFDDSAPSVRMVVEILQTVETFFAESGCPLTYDQTVLLSKVLGELREAAS